MFSHSQRDWTNPIINSGNVTKNLVLLSICMNERLVSKETIV